MGSGPRLKSREWAQGFTALLPGCRHNTPCSHNCALMGCISKLWGKISLSYFQLPLSDVLSEQQERQLRHPAYFVPVLCDVSVQRLILSGRAFYCFICFHCLPGHRSCPTCRPVLQLLIPLSVDSEFRFRPYAHFWNHLCWTNSENISCPLSTLVNNEAGLLAFSSLPIWLSMHMAL